MPDILPPRVREEITPQWMTAVLRDCGLLAGGAVAALMAEDVGVGRGFAGQVLRLRLEFDREVAGPPSSIIAKLPSTTEFAPEVLRGAHEAYANEIRWYERHSASCPIRVPAFYWAGMDPDAGRYCLLIEDLSDLETVDFATGTPPHRAAVAVTGLARLHAHYWGDRAARADGFESPDTPETRGQRASESIEYGWGVFVEAFGEQLPGEFLAAGARLGSAMPRLSIRAAGSLTRIHRDYKVENLLFGEPGGADEVAVLDWQGASVGSGPEDLAYFISGSLATDVRRDHEDRLLRLYHDTLLDAGVTNYTFEQLREDYRIGLLTTIARNIGGVRAAREGQFSGSATEPSEEQRREQVLRDVAIQERVRLNMERKIAAVVDNEALRLLDRVP